MLWLAATLFAAVLATHQPQIVFAVVSGSDGLAIEPITMVTRKAGPCAGCWKLSFTDPVREEDMSKEDFVAQYYRHGRTYRALAGGADVGTASVDKEVSLACVSLAASLTPPVPDSAGLAVGSLHLPPRKVVSIEASAEEVRALSALARRVFRQKGVPAALLEKMEKSEVFSADLNQDGKGDLIGSFEAKGAEFSSTRRLFLIALADDAGGYRTEYVWYFRQNESENSTTTMLFFDTIDLDEDGTDEVIASFRYYEGHDYAILKRSHDGKWKIVYQGGSTGC
jgi:hypothetical protein